MVENPELANKAKLCCTANRHSDGHSDDIPNNNRTQPVPPENQTGDCRSPCSKNAHHPSRVYLIAFRNYSQY